VNLHFKLLQLLQSATENVFFSLVFRELDKLKKGMEKDSKRERTCQKTRVWLPQVIQLLLINRYLPQYNKSCLNVQEIKTTLLPCFPFVKFVPLT